MKFVCPERNTPPGRLQDPAASRWILCVLAAYAICCTAFWPRAVLVTDEGSYVRAAFAFAHGHTLVNVVDGRTGEVRRELPSLYPPGTSAFQAPLVWMLGPGAAPVLSLLSFCLTTLLLARWLVAEGRSPLFALLFAGYLPALVLGRVAMSDVPSALVVTSAQMLLFRSAPGGSRRKRVIAGASTRSPERATLAFLSGLFGAASLLFRETNALFVAPLFVGAVLRRERTALPLIAGAVAGASLRPLAFWLAFGDPFFVKDPAYGWSLSGAFAHLPLYLFALLLMAPLGLWGAAAYRGPRRPEVIATTYGALAFFLAYAYAGEESGFPKSLVLGPRYFLPLVPLLAIALSEALPRVWRARGSPGGERLAGSLARAWAAAALVAAVGVHPVLWRASVGQGEVVDALLATTSSGGALLLDTTEFHKAPYEWNEPRRVASLTDVPPSDLPLLVERDGVAFLALLDRTDSQTHRQRGSMGERWRADAARRCALQTAHDGEHRGMRLRIFRIEHCGDFVATVPSVASGGASPRRPRSGRSKPARRAAGGRRARPAAQPGASSRRRQWRNMASVQTRYIARTRSFPESVPERSDRTMPSTTGRRNRSPAPPRRSSK